MSSFRGKQEIYKSSEITVPDQSNDSTSRDPPEIILNPPSEATGTQPSDDWKKAEMER